MLENITSVPNILGITISLAGILMFVFPPKKINMFYGYRTIRSMKNTENWNFAQKLSSRLMMIFGIPLLVTGIVGIIFSLDESLINIIGVVESIILVIILFIKTESDIAKFEKTL